MVDRHVGSPLRAPPPVLAERHGLREDTNVPNDIAIADSSANVVVFFGLFRLLLFLCRPDPFRAAFPGGRIFGGLHLRGLRPYRLQRTFLRRLAGRLRRLRFDRRRRWFPRRGLRRPRELARTRRVGFLACLGGREACFTQSADLVETERGVLAHAVLPCRLATRAACGLGIVVEMVPLAGLEPARCFHHLILSQARLPIPPQGLEPRIIPTATQESTARAGFMWHIRAMALAGS